MRHALPFVALALSLAACSSPPPAPRLVPEETWEGRLLRDDGGAPLPLRVVVASDGHYFGRTEDPATNRRIGNAVGLNDASRPTFSIWLDDNTGQYVVWGERAGNAMTGDWVWRRPEAGLPVEARGAVDLHLVRVRQVPQPD